MANGRPRKEINWNLVELYLQAGCTQKKICESLNISPDVIQKRIREKYGMGFTALAESLYSEGDILLLAQGFQKAVKGYWPALHWLLKVRLGQREPEAMQALAANQPQIDQRHYIMQLENEVQELKNGVRRESTEANSHWEKSSPDSFQSTPSDDHYQPEAKQELLRGDAQV